MEIAIVWVPCMPVLGIVVCGSIASNLMLFQAGIVKFGVKLPRDENNLVAALSSSYLTFSLLLSLSLQVWFALERAMHGWQLLLVNACAIMLIRIISSVNPTLLHRLEAEGWLQSIHGGRIRTEAARD